MKSYGNLYQRLCSYKNLEKAFRKARKGKSSKWYVKEFEKDLAGNLTLLKKELETMAYQPRPLKKFVIRDPKTRVIRKSSFRDRIIHHALVNVIEPIYERIFIFDSYANRMGKGTSAALKRFDIFKRKANRDGKGGKGIGYVFKADIKQFFDSVHHDTLIKIFEKKIRDKKVLWLITIIIKNFDSEEKGMPLGNMTSQFFANVYLNGLDYFVKHVLRMKCYLRYVDDFVIIHKQKEILEKCRHDITEYLKSIQLELHPQKSKIFLLYKGVEFLGFKTFYHYRLLRNRNIKRFKKRISKLKEQYDMNIVSQTQIYNSIQGWMAYAKGGNTFKLRKNLMKEVKNIFDKQLCIKGISK